MPCPAEVRSQLLTILDIGIRNIRGYCDRKQYEQCYIEATHIHNIPNLIPDFSPAKLKYYLEIEMPGYLRDNGGRAVIDQRSAWQALGRWHDRRCD